MTRLTVAAAATQFGAAAAMTRSAAARATTCCTAAWATIPLTGGAGADKFVFTENTGNDTITDFDLRHDVIDLRLLPEAISFADLTITAIVATEGLDVPEEIGVTITHDALGGTISIYDITPGSLTEDHFLLPDGETTTVEHEGTSAATQVPDPWDGTEDADFLVADSEASHIRGLGGRDWISGGEGDDTLEGGAGRDVLMGNEGTTTPSTAGTPATTGFPAAPAPTPSCSNPDTGPTPSPTSPTARTSST